MNGSVYRLFFFLYCLKTVVKTEVKTVVKKRAICYTCGRILLHIHAAVSASIEL
jgi:hypothetical protein